MKYENAVRKLGSTSLASIAAALTIRREGEDQDTVHEMLSITLSVPIKPSALRSSLK